MRKLKKLIAVCMILVFAVNCAACGGESAGTSKKKAIKVAVNNAWAPFEFVDEDGNLAGYDYEVSKLAFERMGIEVEYVPVALDGLCSGLQSGMYDVGLANFFATEERRETYHFSYFPLIEASGCTVTRKEEEAFSQLEEAPEDTVFGETSGNVFVTNIEEYNEQNPSKKFDIEYYEETVLVLNDIVNGRVDASLLDMSSARYISKMSGIDDKLTFTQNNYDSGFCFAVFANDSDGAKLANQYGDELKEMYEDGSMSEICTKYFGSDDMLKNLNSATLDRATE